MACFGSIHHAIARLQAVSTPPLQPELVCIGPLKSQFERKLQPLIQVVKPGATPYSALRSRLLVFAATAGQETATSTLVLQEVDFVWKGKGSEVLLTGDFLDWDTKVSLSKGDDGAFHVKQKLSPGNYKYKFIIDGEWVHSPDSPTVPDGKGGFNNEIRVTDGPSTPASLPSSEKDTIKAGVAAASAKPKVEEGTAGTKPVAPAPAAKPAKKAPVDKPLPELMNEDVIPKIRASLQKEEDISDIDLVFQDNQLEGSFKKNGIIYTFWAFFPDGRLEGSRGFSLSSHGAPPSTIEPFLIDEKKISAELLIFWVVKRLYAQKLLSLN